MGSSKGGDLSLALGLVAGEQVPTLASPTPGTQVGAVVTVNGSIASAGGEVTHRGLPLAPALHLRPSFTPRPRPDGSLDCRGALMVGASCKVIQVSGVQELSEATALPVERVQAEVLMVVGEDDHNWDSAM